MDKCREEFEAWVVDNLTPFGAKLDKHEEFDAYIDGAVTAYFMAWKASRESMKAIKLPEATFETPSGDNALREDAVIDAITSAGYEVEE